MRAIQITEFGGPEVLDARRPPRPAAAGDQRPRRRHCGRRQLRRHPPGRGLLPRAAAAAAGPRRRGGRPSTERRAAASWRCSPAAAATPSRRWRPRPTTFTLPDQRRRRRPPSPWCCRARPRGTCCAPARTWPPASRSSCTRLRAASARSRCSSPSSWGAGRVIATASSAEKRELARDLGADVASTCPDGRGLQRSPSAARGQRRSPRRRRPRDDRRPRLRRLRRALAPFGRLVAYGMASRTPPTPIHAGRADGRPRAPSSASGWCTRSASPAASARRWRSCSR